MGLFIKKRAVPTKFSFPDEDYAFENNYMKF